jgi:hypothetical protein
VIPAGRSERFLKADISDVGYSSSLIASRYGRGGLVGRGLGVGEHLPVHGVDVGVGVGVAVGVAVDVAVGVTVAVAVGVAVAVAVGVTLGVTVGVAVGV